MQFAKLKCLKIKPEKKNQEKYFINLYIKKQTKLNLYILKNNSCNLTTARDTKDIGEQMIKYEN